MKHCRYALLPVAIVYLAACLPTHASAQERGLPTTVSIELKNESIFEALRLLFLVGKRKYEMSPTMKSALRAGTVTISAQDVKFETVLDMLVRTSGANTPFTYRLDGDVYIIEPGAPREPRPARRPQPEIFPGLSAKNVTLSLRNTDFREAFAQLFKQVGVPYTLHPALAEPAYKGRITRELEEVPFWAALEMLREKTAGNPLGLAADPVIGAFFIHPDYENKPTPDLATKPVTLKAVHQPAWKVVAKLLEQAGVDYALPVDPLEAAVPLVELDHGRVKPIIQSILERQAATPHRLDSAAGVWMVIPENGPSTAAPLAGRRVTLLFKEVDVRYALKALFSGVQANYVLDREVVGDVTLRMENATLTDALGALLKATRAAGPLTYTVEDHVYKIVPKKR
jgi:hypothetical protein